MENIIYHLFPVLKIKAEIRKIIREEYGNYRGQLVKPLKSVHRDLRKMMGPREFLAYLHQSIILNPKPKYRADSYAAQKEKWMDTWINGPTGQTGITGCSGPTGCTE